MFKGEVIENVSMQLGMEGHKKHKAGGELPRWS